MLKSLSLLLFCLCPPPLNPHRSLNPDRSLNPKPEPLTLNPKPEPPQQVPDSLDSASQAPPLTMGPLAGGVRSLAFHILNLTALPLVRTGYAAKKGSSFPVPPPLEISPGGDVICV